MLCILFIVSQITWALQPVHCRGSVVTSLAVCSISLLNICYCLIRGASLYQLCYIYITEYKHLQGKQLQHWSRMWTAIGCLCMAWCRQLADEWPLRCCTSSRHLNDMVSAFSAMTFRTFIWMSVVDMERCIRCSTSAASTTRRERRCRVRLAMWVVSFVFFLLTF